MRRARSPGRRLNMRENSSKQVAAQNGWKEKSFAGDAIAELRRYSWPGNVRELRNVVERLVLLAGEGAVSGADVTMALPGARGSGAERVGGAGVASAESSGTLADRTEAFEREVLLAEIRRHNFHMTNVARALGLERSHLYKKCQQLGIDLHSLRGLGRAMTQFELAQAMKREVGRGLSQAYLSQIESGARPHLTHTTRELLARFFRVYPGFLVDDPEGYTPGLQSELRAIDAKVDSWLFGGAEQFTADPALQRALLTIAEHEDSRRAILLLAEILRTPDLAERLGEVLHPGNHQNGGQPRGSGHPPPASPLRN